MIKFNARPYPINIFNINKDYVAFSKNRWWSIVFINIALLFSLY